MSLCRAIIWPFAVVVSAVVACSPAPSPDVAVEASLRANVAFTCLWWSEAQMEGFNPNSPPPKNTEVKLTKWEYSDPVGVPHPDIVDVVITLENSGRALPSLEVEVNGQWKEGSRQDAATAEWSQPVLLRRFPGIALGPSGSVTLRAPVDLKARIYSRVTQQKWPQGLRATVTVRDNRAAQSLVHANAELPILRGD